MHGNLGVSEVADHMLRPPVVCGRMLAARLSGVLVVVLLGPAIRCVGCRMTGWGFALGMEAKFPWKMVQTGRCSGVVSHNGSKMVGDRANQDRII